MRGASSALLISLVAAVAAAVLHPPEEDVISQLESQLLAGLGMQRPPDMSRINTTVEQMQRMTRRYYKSLRESERDLRTYHPSGFKRHSYLLFNIEASDLSSFQWAKLRFPNSTTLDVSAVVRNWRDNAHGVLLIQCKERQCERAELQIMVRSSRRKRSACSDQCCRRSLKISFKNLGWNWIVKPEEFEAYYCKGRCRNVTSNFASTHALMQSILNIKGYKVARLCCAPRKLRALDVLHYNDKSELVVSRQKGMIVKECSCL